MVPRAGLPLQGSAAIRKYHGCACKARWHGSGIVGERLRLEENMRSNRASKSHPLSLTLLAALLCASGCDDETDENGTSGIGAGPGPSSGSGQTAQCAETVDSVVITNGPALTPSILRVDGGYAVALIKGGEAWIVMIDESAGVLNEKQLSNAAGKARLATVHPVGGGLVALWAQGSAVWTRALDGSGNPSGTAAQVAMTTSPEPRPSGASTGDALAVAWMQGQQSIAGILQGATLQQQTPVPGLFPAVAVSNGEIAVSWSNGVNEGPVQVASIAAMGSATQVAGSSSLIKSMAAAPDGYFVAWEDLSTGVEQIGLARVNLAQGVVAQSSPAEAGSSANWPAIAWSGQFLAITFYQFRDSSPSVFLTFADAELAPAGNEVEIAGDAKFPSVAWGQDVAAVAYNVENGPVAVSVVSCQ
jgi:hypothetical protein